MNVNTFLLGLNLRHNKDFWEIMLVDNKKICGIFTVGFDWQQKSSSIFLFCTIASQRHVIKVPS
jgi:hypothetical protein